MPSLADKPSAKLQMVQLYMRGWTQAAAGKEPEKRWASISAHYRSGFLAGQKDRAAAIDLATHGE